MPGPASAPLGDPPVGVTAPGPEDEQAPSHAPWPPWTAPVALLAGLVVAVVGFGVIAVILAGLTGTSLTHPPLGITLGGTVFQDIALVGSALVFARAGASALDPAQLGLRSTDARRSARLIVGVLVASLLFSILWVAALGIHDRENLHRELGLGSDLGGILATALVVTTIAPVAEEVFFRGYFFAALSRWRGHWVAAVLTGIVFGAVHGLGQTPVAFLVPLAFLGFLLCLLYQRTGSLYPGIAVHVLNNALAFGLDEHWGWQIPVLMLVDLAVVGLVMVPLVRAGVRLGTPARPAPAAA